MDQWKTTIINFLTLYGFQVVGALIILAVGDGRGALVWAT